MRRSEKKWFRSAISLVVLGAALLAARPAVAGSVSFSVNMTGEYVTVKTANGVELHMQPFNGTMPPFGQCQAAEGATTGLDVGTMVFTLANGMTITASVTCQFGNRPVDPIAVTGTITGGAGIFEDASGTITGTITADPATFTATVLPLTFTASGP